MATIFTRIAKGEIPSYKCAENEDFYAFLDIAPMAKGHTLVIPKHVEDDYLFHLDEKTYAPRTILSEMGRAKDDGVSPTEYLRQAGMVSDLRRKKLGEVYAEYSRRREQKVQQISQRNVMTDLRARRFRSGFIYPHKYAARQMYGSAAHGKISVHGKLIKTAAAGHSLPDQRTDRHERG